MQLDIKTKVDKSAQAGFTLLEIAVALLIAGLALGGALIMIERAEQQRAYTTTYRNMDLILEALAVYTESNGRLPCPADPGRSDAVFGWEWGVTAAQIGDVNANDQTVKPRPRPGDTGPAATRTCRSWANPTTPGGNPKNMGILPFLTLGLPHETILDGWGNYFTYAVSPVYAQINDDIDQSDPSQDDEGEVHIDCLDGSWFDGGDNVHAVKAKFCCNKNGRTGVFGPNNDIKIEHTDGGDIWPGGSGEIYHAGRDTAVGNYFDVAPTEAQLSGDDGFFLIEEAMPYNTLAPAFVVISHGENGLGAFLGNDSRARFADGTTPSANEQENGAGVGGASFDQTFIDGPRNMSGGANHFDDIVVWRTQEGIMAESLSSCRYP